MKNKFIVVERVSIEVEIGLNSEIIEALSSFWAIVLNECGDPFEVVNMRLGEGLKTYDALKEFWSVNSDCKTQKRKLYEGVMVPAVT